jgi:hypothetical protein
MTLSKTAPFALLAAALAAAAALLLADNGTPRAQAATGAGVSPQAVTLTLAMNKLWEDHIEWTRQVIVDFAAGLPDLKTAEARLLRNQDDIGNAIKPYYGNAAGEKLSKLLRTHILEAVPVLAAAKAGDKAKLAHAVNVWYANAHQIAAFLSAANPAWSLNMMDAMMKTHLALTTNEAVARLKGHWAADVKAYDQVHAEILDMSKMLSDGIIQQFPAKF